MVLWCQFVSDFYTGLAATATRLLTSKGKVVTFTRYTSTDFDPAQGINTTTTSTFTGNGAAFGYKSGEIDGTVVIKGDIRLIVDAMTTPPLIEDNVTIDSLIYRVMNVEKVNPAGTPVIYKVQLRK